MKEIYNGIIDKINDEIECGRYYLATMCRSKSVITEEFFNQCRKEVIDMLREDGFKIKYDVFVIEISWEHPAELDYAVGGAKYNESKKSIEEKF